MADENTTVETNRARLATVYAAPTRRHFVRVIVRELGTTPSNTVLKRAAFCVDSIGSYCTACVGMYRKFSPSTPGTRRAIWR